MGKTVLTAPRCRIMIDGKTLAFGTNVSINEAYDVQAVKGIDALETLERPDHPSHGVAEAWDTW